MRTIDQDNPEITIHYCPANQHDFFYQLMTETIVPGRNRIEKSKRVLICRKCGQIREVDFDNIGGDKNE